MSAITHNNRMDNKKKFIDKTCGNHFGKQADTVHQNGFSDLLLQFQKFSRRIATDDTNVFADNVQRSGNDNAIHSAKLFSKSIFCGAARLIPGNFAPVRKHKLIHDAPKEKQVNIVHHGSKVLLNRFISTESGVVTVTVKAHVDTKSYCSHRIRITVINARVRESLLIALCLRQ